jgi:predicted DNA-binding transcriptional regulator YafY
MARGDQLSRQWRIIQTLISARQGKSASELAHTLECHSRTIYRDLEALQAAGFPLYNQKRDNRTVWSILEAGRNQMPIPLCLTELMALYFSRNMLNVLEGSAIHNSLISLFEKVKATLPRQYIDYLKKIEHSLTVGVKAHKPYRKFRSTLDRVQKAVQNHQLIHIRYFTMNRQQMTRRQIAPYQIWYFDETFYLIGHCYQRKEVRLFAIDRIEQIEVSDSHFEPPQGFDAEQFMHASFGVFRGQSENVKIRFSQQAAGYVAEKMWHPTQKLTPQPDGSLIFNAQVAGIDEIKMWILKWGAGAQVLAPESLRQAVALEAQAMLKQYKADPQAEIKMD